MRSAIRSSDPKNDMNVVRYFQFLRLRFRVMRVHPIFASRLCFYSEVKTIKKNAGNCDGMSVLRTATTVYIVNRTIVIRLACL